MNSELHILNYSIKNNKIYYYSLLECFSMNRDQLLASMMY
jgi:hypothetical protein